MLPLAPSPRLPLYAALLVVALFAHAHAQENSPGITDPPLPDGTQSATQRIAGLKMPAGLAATLFAAEPQLASPVAICLDEQGRVFVAEEYRFNRGTEENRTRPFFLEDDLQLKTTRRSAGDVSQVRQQIRWRDGLVQQIHRSGALAHGQGRRRPGRPVERLCRRTQRPARRPGGRGDCRGRRRLSHQHSASLAARRRRRRRRGGTPRGSSWPASA